MVNFQRLAVAELCCVNRSHLLSRVVDDSAFGNNEPHKSKEVLGPQPV
jgi:hypothetical protein